jgi:hypothetical protein
MQQFDISLPRIIDHAYRRGRDRGLDMVTQQRLAVAAVRAVRPDLDEGEVVSLVERQESADCLDGSHEWHPSLPEAPSLPESPSLSEVITPAETVASSGSDATLP